MQNLIWKWVRWLWNWWFRFIDSSGYIPDWNIYVILHRSSERSEDASSGWWKSAWVIHRRFSSAEWLVAWCNECCAIYSGITNLYRRFKHLRHSKHLRQDPFLPHAYSSVSFRIWSVERCCRLSSGAFAAGLDRHRYGRCEASGFNPVDAQF